jgi:hypothetical protein
MGFFAGFAGLSIMRRFVETGCAPSPQRRGGFFTGFAGLTGLSVMCRLAVDTVAAVFVASRPFSTLNSQLSTKKRKYVLRKN